MARVTQECSHARLASCHLTQHRMAAIEGKTFFVIGTRFSPKGEWADPGGTAIPGQPVGKSEQAPASPPKFKNQFNIVDLQWRSYQILS